MSRDWKVVIERDSGSSTEVYQIRFVERFSIDSERIMVSELRKSRMNAFVGDCSSMWIEDSHDIKYFTLNSPSG
jgi:hypothetical protein